jgi:pyrroline-5-carboxylate reductase
VSPTSLGSSIWLVGAGNMGGAMLRGWLASGIAPERITVINRSRRDLSEGVIQQTEPPEGWPDTLVLAVKPQQLDAMRTMFAGRDGGPRLLMSILAGVEVETLGGVIPASHIVRAMPNLPVAIGKGVTLLFTAGAEVRGDAETLAAPLGLTEWIASEALFDAATALSGCGPGFVFRFIDALAFAGARLGLPADQAQRLALATVEGSALMAAGSDENVAVLADRVASPGGSTREGLNVLDRDDVLVELLVRTLSASADRNREMAAEARSRVRT